MARQSAITANHVPRTTDLRTLVVTGSNLTTIATVVVTGVPNTVIQTTSTAWRAELRLSRGDNLFRISGIDVVGNVSESLTFTVTLAILEQEPFQTRNVFDNFGDMLALPRLPGEKNLPYLNRLRDVMVHPTATTLRGVTYGAARDLGLRVESALRISSPRDTDVQQPRAVNGAIEVGQVYFDLQSVRLRATDCVRVEPATQTALLSRVPLDKSTLSITTSEGDPIAPEDYDVDFRNGRVLFLTHLFNGQELMLAYQYRERIPLRGTTLGQLKTAIEAVVGLDGLPLFLVDLLLDETTAAENLIPIDLSFVGELELELEACPLRVRELLNTDFQVAELNSDDHAINTKIEQWARRINMEARVIWDAAYLGESVWEPLGEEPRLGVLPHLTDASRGYWSCRDASDGTRFTLNDFRANSGLCPLDGTSLEYHGIFPLQFQSGTGTRDDLCVKEIIAVSTEG